MHITTMGGLATLAPFDDFEAYDGCAVGFLRLP
jgi:hypothetical protein